MSTAHRAERVATAGLAWAPRGAPPPPTQRLRPDSSFVSLNHTCCLTTGSYCARRGRATTHQSPLRPLAQGRGGVPAWGGLACRWPLRGPHLAQEQLLRRLRGVLRSRVKISAPTVAARRPRVVSAGRNATASRWQQAHPVFAVLRSLTRIRPPLLCARAPGQPPTARFGPLGCTPSPCCRRSGRRSLEDPASALLIRSCAFCGRHHTPRDRPQRAYQTHGCSGRDEAGCAGRLRSDTGRQRRRRGHGA